MTSFHIHPKCLRNGKRFDLKRTDIQRELLHFYLPNGRLSWDVADPGLSSVSADV